MAVDNNLNTHVQELKKDLTHKHYLLTVIFLLNAYFLFLSKQQDYNYFVLGLMFFVLVDIMGLNRLIETLKILQAGEGE